MIFFIGRDSGVQLYLSGWGASLSRTISLLSYERLLLQRKLVPGTYVFMNNEELSASEAEWAELFWTHFHNSDRGIRLLNHPTRSLKRYELLRALKEREINSFDVYRVTEARRPKRFPVFIREANQHSGSLTPLLYTQAALESAVKELLAGEMWRREEKIIVEYCDTADESGLYRKYSAFCVGNRIIPVYLSFSKNWVTKSSDSVDERMSTEELLYVQTNPHEEQLREIFALADIQYGRIDYAVFNGGIQTWEINTNPHLIPRVPERSPRFAALRHGSSALNAAFREIDSSLNPPIQISNPVRRRVVLRERREALHRWLRSFGLLRYEPAALSISVFCVNAPARVASSLKRR
jgi:hypothetical protein